MTGCGERLIGIACGNVSMPGIWRTASGLSRKRLIESGRSVPKSDRCPKCGRRKKRSTDANRRYWALLSEIANDIRPRDQSYSSDTWHRYFCQRFLGADEVRVPNEKTLIVPHGSSDLDVQEFNDFMMQVEEFAGRHGVYLEMLE